MQYWIDELPLNEIAADPGIKTRHQKNQASMLSTKSHVSSPERKRLRTHLELVGDSEELNTEDKCKGLGRKERRAKCARLNASGMTVLGPTRENLVKAEVHEDLKVFQVRASGEQASWCGAAGRGPAPLQ